MELREQIARAIWKVRPDCANRQWPFETAQERRAYPHNPVAACDLCFIYADAALEVLSVGRHAQACAGDVPRGAIPLPPAS